ncbi:MAG: hypothetical protein RR058_06265 [Oscillospiraceae bacterium]
MKYIAALLVLTAVFLTGCAPTKNTINLPHFPDENSASEGKHELEELNDCSNDKFYYSYGRMKDNESFRLMAYTDFEENENRVLCNIKDCKHDSEQCEAWVGVDNINCVQRLPCHNYLFWIGMCEVPNDFPNENEYVDAQRRKSLQLFVSNEDGTHKRELLVGKECTAPPMSVLYSYCDGEMLYCIVAENEIDDYILEQAPLYLLKIEISSGKLAQEVNLGRALSNSNSLGVFNGSPYFYVFSWNKDVIGFTAYGLSLKTGELTKAFEIKDVKDMQLLENRISDGRLYFGQNADKSIVSYDIVSGKLTFEMKIPDDWVDYKMEHIGDRYVISADTKTERVKYFTFRNVGDKPQKFVPITFFYEKQDKIKVLGESKTDFFVAMDTKMVRSHEISPDGNPVFFDEFYFDYAMIKKDDYFNGIPNFREIKYTQRPTIIGEN